MGTLEVRSLSRIRDGVLVFDEVSFIVPDGRITAVAGPALSGKTSLLRVIAGMERSDGGDVLMDGQSLLRLPTERRRLGFLFDDLALFEDMTVRENVAFGLRMQRRNRVDRMRRTDDILDALDLGGRAHRKPRDLSPGERKRLAFARAVAPEPSLLLLDEPTSGVEEVGREAWRQELAQALRALHVTTLIATTDLRDAVVLADELVLMAEGQVIQTGSVARVLQGPSSIEAATLAGYVPLVRGDVVEGHVIEPGVGAIPFPEAFPLRQHAAVMAHPTALFGVPGGSGLGSGISGVLLRSRPDGPVYVVEIQLNDRTVSLRWEWDLMPPGPGASVEVAVRPGTLRFFNDTPAPRVRTAESATVDPSRFAVLAPRGLAGTDAPGPQAPTPSPEGPNEIDLSDHVADDAEAGVITPSEQTAHDSTTKPDIDDDQSDGADGAASGRADDSDTGDRLAVASEPVARVSASATSVTDHTDTEVAPEHPSEAPTTPAETASPPEETPVIVPRLEPRPGDSPRVATEPARASSATTDAQRPRPTRPSLPTTEPPETHTSTYGPSPSAPPPPKPDDRHGGMPLD